MHLPIEVKDPELAPDLTPREKVLVKAREYVSRDRAKTYDTQGESNLKRIAKYWSLYLNVPVSPVDVGILMALLKVARISRNPHHEDSYVDLAGYAAIAYEAACSPES